MSEQQSQKTWNESDNQKRAISHRQFQPVPARNRAGGAHGEHAPTRDSDVDLSLQQSTRRSSKSQEKET